MTKRSKGWQLLSKRILTLSAGLMSSITFCRSRTLKSRVFCQKRISLHSNFASRTEFAKKITISSKLSTWLNCKSSVHRFAKS